MLWLQRQIQTWQNRVAFTCVRAESASWCFSGQLALQCKSIAFCVHARDTAKSHSSSPLEPVTAGTGSGGKLWGYNRGIKLERLRLCF